VYERRGIVVATPSGNGLAVFHAWKTRHGKGTRAMRTVRMLISDVDGTLITHGRVLTDRTLAAVERLRSAGIEFGITSGRPPRGMAMFAKPLRITCPIAAFNGGMLVKPDLTTVLEQRPLARAIAAE